MKLRELYKNSIIKLENAGIENAATETRFLINGILHISYTELFITPEMEITDDEVNALLDAVKRRLNNEPLQYIIGSWDFLDNSFRVGPGVLIPRPETELLCEKVALEAQNIDQPVIYDLCSGSGCIGISVKQMVSDAKVYLVEKSEDALLYLRKNVKEICKTDPPVVIHGDVLDFEFFKDLPKADIIVSNPPYIASNEVTTLQKEVSGFEPHMALDGGADGLVFYRYIVENWKHALKNGGSFFFEIGEDQGRQVSDILNANGFDSYINIDYNNHDRIVIGRMK